MLNLLSAKCKSIVNVSAALWFHPIAAVMCLDSQKLLWQAFWLVHYEPPIKATLSIGLKAMYKKSW